MKPVTLAAQLFSTYEQYLVDILRPSNCRHREVSEALQTLIAEGRGVFRVEETGRSTEGRGINMVSCGDGPVHVLLWTQMHGDESTATLALLDVFRFITREWKQGSWIDDMLMHITVHSIVMLNPDGAERNQRHTALHIDMNRDARVLATPEAKILREAQRRLNPAFGFNLHDQGLSSVGNTPRVAALALLAPAMDPEKSLTPIRVRAMRIGALIVRSLNQFADGHLATYDDSFEPRAFGDSMQSWGTSTLLIESGHWPGDPGKIFVRKLNFVAILTSLGAIADGSYEQEELLPYTGLRMNGKRAYDLIIRNVMLTHGNGWSHSVDIGLAADPANNPGASRDGNPLSVMTVKEVGDLSMYGSLGTIDASGKSLTTTSLTIEKAIVLRDLLEQLQISKP